jgi:Ca2+-binding EF-hand superfamily protein
MFQVRLLVLGCAAVASACMAQGANEKQDLHKVFIYNDLDKNGCLSAGEWQKMTENIISLRPKSSDKSQRQVLSSLEAFSQLDLNRDGCLSETEYSTFLPKL